MTELIRINRRLFLTRLGKGAIAMAIMGACEPDTASSTTATSAPPDTVPSTTVATTTTAVTTATTSPAATIAEYLRVDLGFVSAYIVVRGAEVAVVDTGVAGSENAIEAALATADMGWDSVAHVILTHHHPDHVGSMPAVLTAAPGATAYVGEADLDSVSGPRELVAVRDGDDVFGLSVIGTPGHTAGHISLWDPAASVLIAGDALNGADGGVAGPNPQFSENHEEALVTVGKMAGFEYEALYFGHGEPVLEGASALVADLADSL